MAPSPPGSTSAGALQAEKGGGAGAGERGQSSGRRSSPIPGRCAPSGQRDCRGRRRQPRAAGRRAASAPPRPPPSRAPGRSPPPSPEETSPQREAASARDPGPGRRGRRKRAGAAAAGERERPLLRSPSLAGPTKGPSPQGGITATARPGGHRAPPGPLGGQRARRGRRRRPRPEGRGGRGGPARCGGGGGVPPVKGGIVLSSVLVSQTSQIFSVVFIRLKKEVLNNTCFGKEKKKKQP